MTDFFDLLIHEFELPLKNPVLVFSVILFIILLSPIVLRRLNIPGIIGLIISGIFVGPFGLNILENNSAVDLFSTIGLLYIMFIAGLELDMNEFKANRNKSILFGFFTFIIPLSIGFPICHFLLEYDLNASLLIASMFATHTLVAYPIVSKLGVTKNQAVAVTVGGTILTDTAVLILLAIIMGNHQGSLNQEFWLKLGVSLVIFSAIMFFVIPRISKWFFKNLEGEKHAHYIFVLSVVFLSAFLAEISGLEPIIGAFMAGLALNPLIPQSSALMNRIEFIGSALFIPFFLVSVGMLIDINVLLRGSYTITIAAVLTTGAIFGKWLAAYFTQKVFKYSKVQRQLIFGLSSAHAAAILAVVLVGFKAEILDIYILNGTIILILITCMVASFVTEKAARKIVISSEDDIVDLKKSIEFNNERILIPIANIGSIEKLLEFSIFIKDKKSSNPVSILTVVSNNNEAEVNILKARSKFEEFVKQASASETIVNVITTIDHNTASGIARISREIMATVIVLGWPHRTGFLDKLIGEKIDSIINNTDKTTLICHLEKPLVLHKRLILVTPPLAEHENGFNQWFSKIVKLVQELSVPILFYCTTATEEAVQKLIKQDKISVTLMFRFFDDWEDFLILLRDIHPDDLFVMVSARKGSTSYQSILEHIPSKLEKHFVNLSKLIIYPQQHSYSNINKRYDDMTAEPLNKGIETVQKIGKGIGNIFKKGEHP